MTENPGRREASKQAVRAALMTAAHELFARHGFEATTVRDIAAAANVTERTFYRYFDGKEGLIADEYRSWLAALREAIVARPAAEPPAVAIQRAMVLAAERIARDAGPLSSWLFSDGQPAYRLRRYTPRPLLQLETTIADAILARARIGDGDAPGGASAGSDPAFRAMVIARVAVAALRSALIRHRELRAAGTASPQRPVQLLEAAFAITGEAWRDLS